MYSSTFTFSKGHYDDEYHRLDQAIADMVKSIPGYLGEEAWENPANGLISTVYYWESLDALHVLINHPLHRQAKAQQARWLDGYQVVISQVIKVYGDNQLRAPYAAIAPLNQTP